MGILASKLAASGSFRDVLIVSVLQCRCEERAYANIKAQA
jgi:hypothetical protein